MPNDELKVFIKRFKELSEEIQASVTPEFIATLDHTQLAWMMEHLEHLREEALNLKDKIEQLLDEKL